MRDFGLEHDLLGFCDLLKGNYSEKLDTLKYSSSVLFQKQSISKAANIKLAKNETIVFPLNSRSSFSFRSVLSRAYRRRKMFVLSYFQSKGYITWQTS